MENLKSKVDKWVRYRFGTYSVDDWRPLIYNPAYPCWCSGYGENKEGGVAIMIAYLPKGEDLMKYWDDAFNIESTEHHSIEFTDRFPKPKDFIES